MIDTEQKVYPIALLCEVDASFSEQVYAWRKRGKSAKQKADEKLIPVVQEAHRISKGTYGTRRIAEEALFFLNASGSQPATLSHEEGAGLILGPQRGRACKADLINLQSMTIPAPEALTLSAEL